MQWLRSNFTLKIVALALATVAWFFVKNITNERRVVENVPVDIKLPDNCSLASAKERTVSVIVAGTRTDIWQVSRSEMVATVDLSREGRTGLVRVTLNPQSVRHPSRVQVVQVVPAEIIVQLIPVTVHP